MMDGDGSMMHIVMQPINLFPKEKMTGIRISKDFNLSDITDLMDFAERIIEHGDKYKGEYPTVGGFHWENYRIFIMNTGDIILSDDLSKKSMIVFYSDRSQNNEIMRVRGQAIRLHLIESFVGDKLKKKEEPKIVLN